MSKRKTYHVTPNSAGAWQVKAEGGERASSVEATKADAIARAVQIAQNQRDSQVIIHRKDGTIESERTYGNDPYPPKG